MLAGHRLAGRRPERGVKDSPAKLASAGCGQEPESAGESLNDGEPSPVQVRIAARLTRQCRTVVADGQPQDATLPLGQGHVDVGAGMN
jgi:hypothetical protein